MAVLVVRATRLLPQPLMPGWHVVRAGAAAFEEESAGELLGNVALCPPHLFLFETAV